MGTPEPVGSRWFHELDFPGKRGHRNSILTGTLEGLTISLWSIRLVGFGVSTDAFTASLTNGVKMGRFNYRHTLIVALTFVGFQAAMPLLEQLLAANFASLLDPFDHWIAFALLATIGDKMAWEAFQVDKNEDDDGQGSGLDLRRLLILRVAASIDAAAVGVSFVMPEVSILLAILYIGLVTLVTSLAVVGVGRRIGTRFRRPAEFLGGVVLIIIGARILLEKLDLLQTNPRPGHTFRPPKSGQTFVKGYAGAVIMHWPIPKERHGT